MLFNSLEFLIFLALFFALWPFLRRTNTSRWVYLTVASFFFYGWWDWRFLFLLLGSGLIDFWAGFAMERWPRHRRWFLIASMTGNIGSLALFKYFNFFIRNTNHLLHLFGFHDTLPGIEIVLPVGISFYTFQSMSYTIDIYRGQLKPTKNFFHFFAYLSMFPQLVAGPIVRAADLLPQLTHVTHTTEKTRWDGLMLIAQGYFKKVVVADTLAPVINAAFASSVPFDSACYWWIVMSMFAFQIYCDFSGYSDIARGLAKWMGYEFMVNFDHPYVSTSIREFWSRWHISLSTWFRDYLYIPLGGSRGGMWAGMRNMWITMVVSGLWHGAANTFIIWGALHAFYLTLERLTNWPKRLCSLKGGRVASAIVIFVLVLISWVFFRGTSTMQAFSILTRLFDLTSFNASAALAQIHDPKAIFLLLLMAARQAYVFYGGMNWSWNENRWVMALRPVAVSLLLVACVYLRGPGAAFIYFQF